MQSKINPLRIMVLKLTNSIDWIEKNNSLDGAKKSPESMKNIACAGREINKKLNKIHYRYSTA